MNLFAFRIVFIFFGFTLLAQEKLKVTYEGTMTIDETNATRKFSGRFVPATFELIIDGKLSEFKEVEKLITSQEGEAPPFTIGMGVFIIDLSKSVFYSYWEQGNRKYLVLNDIKAANWKIQKETSEILGYEVRKAIFESDGSFYTAWYAQKLPFKIGPEFMGGLPGLILKIEIQSTTEEKAVWKRSFVVKQIEVLNENYQLEFPKLEVITAEKQNELYKESTRKLREIQSVDKD